MGYRTIYEGAVVMLVIAACVVSCNTLDDKVTADQNRIRTELENQSIWERNNLPDDPLPSKIEGYFDIVGGAYRYIVNEYITGSGGVPRINRDLMPVISKNDSISFYFDARIYTGKWENSTTFYTNIESLRDYNKGDNDEFQFDFWPAVPMRIKVGEDPKILKALQVALLSEPYCRAAGTTIGDVQAKDEEGNLILGPDGKVVMVPGVIDVESDQVRIYLTPDIAFHNKWVYNVPAGSTIVYELTDIHIIE